MNRHCFPAAFTLAALALATGASAQTKWDLASGYGANTFQTKNLEQFAADVKAATGGKLQITVHSNASLVKMPEMKRAIQSGQAPIGEILISVLANEDAMFGFESVPGLAPSYAEARKLHKVAAEQAEAYMGGARLVRITAATEEDFCQGKLDRVRWWWWW